MKLFLLFISAFYIFHLFDSASSDTFMEEEKEVVDPNSLFYSRQKKKVVIPERYESSNELEIRYESNEYYTYCNDRSYEVFARRLINILLKNARLKVHDDNVTGSVNIEANLQQLEILKGFGEGKISIRQLDSIIGDVIRQPPVDLLNEFFSYTDMLCFYLYERRKTFVSLLVSMIIIPIIVKGTRTKLGIITLLFSVITIISFVMTWMQLLQDAEIKLAAQRHMYYKMPDECATQDIGFIASFKLFWGIGKGDCLKYYEAIMNDPMLEVTPVHAFIHMCCKSISYPLLLFGKEFSHFTDAISDSLPWWIQPIAKPLIFSLTLLLVYSLTFILVGGKFGVRIGPLFHFYIHGREWGQSSIDYNTSIRQPIEILQSETREIENITQTQVQTNRGSMETCEVMSVTQVQTQTVSNVPVKKESPKTEEESTQIKEIEHVELESQEGSSGSNSDEFLDDNEYEKISKKLVESEMNRTRIEVLEGESAPKEQIQKDKSRTPMKKSLKIGSGDSYF
ncbi:uncharacterized protein LOC106638992 [Copidosoma floridanum]|uniref:uncharacterized protein LOC106638992 n=1 Tax=Copidosoma floridanum TaxID=29053 RepID=UPI0006C94D80|nr:uncharacterized protein LOC106638992 [Copidosoma floridanum]